MALGHANMILTWEENLAAEEMPPRWMWHLPWELDRWMARVIAARKAKYGADGGDEEPEGEPWVADRTDVDDWMKQNAVGAR